MTLVEANFGQLRYDFGGRGPALHLAVGNGFPAETYGEMVSPLLSDFTVFSWLPRALWSPAPALETASSWKQMAEDLLVGLSRDGHQEVIGVGHSMGGVATFLAAVMEPQRFRGIVLLDPVIFPSYALLLVRILCALGLSSKVPLSRSAKRRKARFSSQEEAFLYWRSKRLFSDWSDEVLRLYTQGILRQEGEEWVLGWSPHWEAHYFETLFTKSWSYWRKLPSDLPLLLIRGEKTDTLFLSVAKKLKKLLPHMDYEEVNAGHLFPQAAPEETASIIEAWLDKHQLR